jgi:hypothetical protein
MPRAVFGRPGGTRTPSPRFWRPMLYQLSYWPIPNGKFGVRRLKPDCPNVRRSNFDVLTSWHVWIPTSNCLLALPMCRVLPAEPTVLAELEPLRTLAAVLRRAVVAAFAVGARQRHYLAHDPSPKRSPRPPSASPDTGPSDGHRRHPSVTRQSPKSFRRRPSGRLRESRSARPFRAPPASSVHR